MLTPSNQYLQAVEEINDYVNQAKCRASVRELHKGSVFYVLRRESSCGFTV